MEGLEGKNTGKANDSSKKPPGDFTKPEESSEGPKKLRKRPTHSKDTPEERSKDAPSAKPLGKDFERPDSQRTDLQGKEGIPGKPAPSQSERLIPQPPTKAMQRLYARFPSDDSPPDMTSPRAIVEQTWENVASRQSVMWRPAWEPGSELGGERENVKEQRLAIIREDGEPSTSSVQEKVVKGALETTRQRLAMRDKSQTNPPPRLEPAVSSNVPADSTSMARGGLKEGMSGTKASSRSVDRHEVLVDELIRCSTLHNKLLGEKAKIKQKFLSIGKDQQEIQKKQDALSESGRVYLHRRENHRKFKEEYEIINKKSGMFNKPDLRNIKERWIKFGEETDKNYKDTFERIHRSDLKKAFASEDRSLSEQYRQLKYLDTDLTMREGIVSEKHEITRSEESDNDKRIAEALLQLRIAEYHLEDFEARQNRSPKGDKEQLADIDRDLQQRAILIQDLKKVHKELEQRHHSQTLLLKSEKDIDMERAIEENIENIEKKQKVNKYDISLNEYIYNDRLEERDKLQPREEDLYGA